MIVLSHSRQVDRETLAEFIATTHPTFRPSLAALMLAGRFQTLGGVIGWLETQLVKISALLTGRSEFAVWYETFSATAKTKEGARMVLDRAAARCRSGAWDKAEFDAVTQAVNSVLTLEMKLQDYS